MKPIVIGTHHKTGTNFFLKLVRALSAEREVTVWDRNATPSAKTEPTHWDIYFDHWSKWVIDLNQRKFAGIHAVRHPFALIYSATLYHLVSDEVWLHRAEDQYAGATYAEALHREPTFEDQLIFEMNNFSKPVIRRMLEVSKDSRFYDVQLENISHDESMEDLNNAFRFCGLEEKEVIEWLEIASRFCLWKLRKRPGHSTTGVSEEWSQYFKGRVLEEYRRLFGTSEIELGYTD